MDTSLIDIDVQPNYVRVTLKGKSLQISFNEDVKPDASTAKRSQTTGHLVITMPKLNPIVRSKPKVETIRRNRENEPKKNEFLEVEQPRKSNFELLANIVDENTKKTFLLNENKNKIAKIRDNSPNFVDDLSVPPLE